MPISWAVTKGRLEILADMKSAFPSLPCITIHETHKIVLGGNKGVVENIAATRQEFSPSTILIKQ